MLAEEQHDGRDDVGEGDLVLLDEAAEVFEVELGHDDKLQTGVQALMDHTCQAYERQ